MVLLQLAAVEGYWLQEHENTKSHLLNVVNSGANSTKNVPLQWRLSIGELRLDSGSVSGSAFDADFGLDTQFESLIYSCMDEDLGFCQNIDYVELMSANLLDKKMTESGETYD